MNEAKSSTSRKLVRVHRIRKSYDRLERLLSSTWFYGMWLHCPRPTLAMVTNYRSSEYDGAGYNARYYTDKVTDQCMHVRTSPLVSEMTGRQKIDILISQCQVLEALNWPFIVTRLPSCSLRAAASERITLRCIFIFNISICMRSDPRGETIQTVCSRKCLSSTLNIV